MLLCVAVVLTLTVFFPIEKINISGSVVYTAEQIEKNSGIEKGDNLFALSKSSVLSQLKQKLPYVENIKIKRELPGTLKIEVVDAEEFACYNFKNKYYVVSESGWVLNELKEKPENIFSVIGADVDCAVGSEIKFNNKKQKELTETITSALSKNGIKTDYVDISKTVDLTLGVEGRFTVSLGTSNDLEEKIAHLAGMIKEADPKIGGKINLSMWTSTNKKGTFVRENTQ